MERMVEAYAYYRSCSRTKIRKFPQKIHWQLFLGQWVLFLFNLSYMKDFLDFKPNNMFPRYRDLLQYALHQDASSRWQQMGGMM